MLNGPPGIGKSTLAQRYVDSHPGVLNLDIDQVARLIGGGRDSGQKLALARSDALAMASAHLRAGSDVLVPQFIGRVSQLERFEAVAAQAQAQFLHIVLMDTRQAVLDRFAERGRSSSDDWLLEIHEDVARNGGDSALARMYDAVADVVRARLTSILITSEAGAVGQTYGLLVSALGREVAPDSPAWRRSRPRCGAGAGHQASTKRTRVLRTAGWWRRDGRDRGRGGPPRTTRGDITDRLARD